MAEDDQIPVEPLDPSSAHKDDQGDGGSHEKKQDRVLMPFWSDVSARKQLKRIAIDEEKTQQALLAEALNMLFESRGKPRVG